MDHPLVTEGHADLRKRMIQLLKTAYSIRRSSNIIFVCGGNDPSNLRPRFAKFCDAEFTEYEIFYPEFAIPKYFSSPIDEPFDIADFETLVGELSHAIVVFPEAPGSFAETGYFSAVEPLSKKTVLVLNEEYQGTDSFLSMGPARKISEASVFQSTVQLDYKNPNFNHVVDRINRVQVKKYKKTLNINQFNALPPYEVFCVVQRIVDLMTIATTDDLVHIIRALSLNRFSPVSVRKIVSIMIGSGYLNEVGEYGHLSSAQNKMSLLDLRDGYRDKENALRLELAASYQEGDPEFLSIAELSRDVG
ncbi:MAG: retron St85 family effector protein [Parvibaculum sp.]|uniref:retron St85 family effector protein n=1 Tax=Parvibaculum sp. TaxID=2024848 RepID=UPI00326535F7